MSNPSSRPLSDKMKAELAAKDYSEQVRKTARPSPKDKQPEFDFDLLEPPPTLEDTRRKLEQKKKTEATSRPVKSVSMKVSIEKKKQLRNASTSSRTSGAGGGKTFSSRSSSRNSSRQGDDARTLDHVARTVRARSREVPPKQVPQPVTSRQKMPAERLFIVLLCAFGIMVMGIAVIILVRQMASKADTPSLLFSSVSSAQRKPVPAPVSALSPGTLVPVTIEQGWGAAAIARLLADSGIVADAESFLSAVMAEGAESSLKAGVHYLQPEMDFPQLISVLTKEKGDEVEVMIYAGLTLSEIDAYVASRFLALPGDFLAAANSLASHEGLGFTEGWFMAGTYRIPVSDAARSLASAMYHATLIELKPVLKNISEQDMAVEEIIIIASMITAETKNPQEMPDISGIIHNRLADGIPLGIDATTRYETGNWSEPIPASVFEKRTPYNTRRVAGLPPSGICAPSSNALLAAAMPPKTSWYYYLHDASGTIHYAEDYEGHKRNIAEYLGR
ncbi:endolytic transglycosylase MltG [Parasphaerochaeta coccoides]|uniref:Endolytic murein transglycosylase n=1 Tax=Parasphaerochaeta coccoides (strain ATCC BAA-1237 / DSM 17374 / SPN1) TaxID=760011 RepID=F4GH50_PARC1|nr:endolytic transglycosylase MltG [Parasphaerochaeta coccoides]AEC01525.1 aminodeoxychorismate lyase [Parasphaerochaeta coccoides DSM 17374]